MINLFEFKNVSVFWFHKDEDRVFLVYKNVAGTLQANQKNNSIRFTLREISGFDDNFELLIKSKKKSIVFKGDCFEDKSKEYPLKCFVSKDKNEVVLFNEDKYKIVHIHLSRKQE